MFDHSVTLYYPWRNQKPFYDKLKITLKWKTYLVAFLICHSALASADVSFPCLRVCRIHVFMARTKSQSCYCICIVRRGGIYDEIMAEPEGNLEGKAQGISQGLRLYCIVFSDSSHNKNILNIERVNYLYCPDSWAIRENISQQIEKYRRVRFQYYNVE